MAKKCNNCGAETTIYVPYIAHESALARSERQKKRLWIVVLVLIGALITSNLAWLIYNSQFENVETWEQSVIQDAENGINNFVGGDVYGKTNN